MKIEAFLKVDGIPGESLAKKHAGEIEVMHWRWGGQNPASMTGSGLSSGKVQVEDLSITKRIDKASPQLLKACFAGAHFANATLTVCAVNASNNTLDDFITFSLTDGMVTSVTSRPPDDAVDIELEDVTFAYSALEFTYKQQKSDGTLTTAGNMTFDVNSRTVS